MAQMLRRDNIWEQGERESMVSIMVIDILIALGHAGYQEDDLQTAGEVE